MNERMTELRRFLKLAYGDRGEQDLSDHLRITHGIDIAGMLKLDAGVFRIDRDEGPAWVARVFIPERTRDRVEGDAAALRYVSSLRRI
jgi:hypothetical protein